MGFIVAIFPLFGIPFLTFGTVMTIGLCVGSMMYQSSEARKAEHRQREAQRGMGKAQAEIAGRQRAIQQMPISAQQMEIFMGARKIENLNEKFENQDQAESRFYTLPTSREQPGIAQQINLWIEQALRT